MREGLTGNLQHWPLTQALTMLCSSRQSGILELNDGPDRAEIGILDGVIVDVTEGPLTGEDALTAVAQWTHGTFVFDNTAKPTARSVSRSTEEVLADITALSAEIAAIKEVIPTLGAMPMLTHELPAAPVTLSPAEWQVVSYADGRTDVAGLCTALGRDALSVSRVLMRLVEGGLVAVSRDGQAVAPSPVRAATPAAAVRAVEQQPTINSVAPSAPTKELAGPVFMRRLEEALRAAMGPIATVAIDDQLGNLGATSATLAREAASTLVERLSAEIGDPRRRVTFTQAMLPELRNLASRRSDAA
ncbi:MAG: DUF4388 domain-containing protein [Dehalococcoidia bacterium]